MGKVCFTSHEIIEEHGAAGSSMEALGRQNGGGSSIPNQPNDEHRYEIEYQQDQRS